METQQTFGLEDSGARRETPTGSVRDIRTGKGRFDLISPVAILRLAQVYERGAEKYDARNWEKGQPLSWYLDSALRHVFEWVAGDRTEDHVAQAAWNLFAYMHTEAMLRLGELPQELNDVPLPLSPDSRTPQARAMAGIIASAQSVRKRTVDPAPSPKPEDSHP